VLATRPDCIYFGGMFDQAAVLFKQARQKGFKGMCLSDDGFDSPDVAKIGSEVLMQGAGTDYSTVSGPASVYPDTKKFMSDFKAKFGSDPQPFAAQSYDATAILLKAIENAARANGGKLPERVDVAKAVRAIKSFHGITGTITFDRKGDPVVAKYFVIQDTARDPAQWPNNKIIQTLEIKAPH
jgi:branched-chain amino acid transport system substrate-binding protein